MDFMLDEDVQLMLKFKTGDNSSFEAILDKYHSPLINFFYRFVGDKIEAEDLAQEAFLRIYRYSHNYKPKAKLSTWIYCIAKNIALNELRRRATHRAASLEETIDAEDSEIKIQFADTTQNLPSQELEKKELENIIKKAIDSLPIHQKTAIILRRFEEFSYEEIAQIMKCSISAVKSLLNRAKENLKEKLKPYLKDN